MNDPEQRWTNLGDLWVSSLRWTVPDADPSAPPLVLVHGMVVAGRSMVPLGSALAARGCRAWAPELPGFGRSGRPARPLDVDGLADSLARWLGRALAAPGPAPQPAPQSGRQSGRQSARQGRPVDLVGNSFGCQVAAALAARHPHLVRRLVLLAPTIDPVQRRRGLALLGPMGKPPGGGPPPPPSPSARLAARAEQRIVAWSWVHQGLRPPLRSLTLAEYLGTGLVRALATFGYAIVDDIQARLPDIPAPTLVLRGDNDRVVSADWAASVARQLPRGTLAEVGGANHSAQYLAADPVADLVAPFLLARRAA